jgi:hypothetical protein
VGNAAVQLYLFSGGGPELPSGWTIPVGGVEVVPVVVAVPTKDEKARIKLSRVAKGRAPFRIQQVMKCNRIRQCLLQWKLRELF